MWLLCGLVVVLIWCIGSGASAQNNSTIPIDRLKPAGVLTGAERFPAQQGSFMTGLTVRTTLSDIATYVNAHSAGCAPPAAGSVVYSTGSVCAGDATNFTWSEVNRNLTVNGNSGVLGHNYSILSIGGNADGTHIAGYFADTLTSANPSGGSHDWLGVGYDSGNHLGFIQAYTGSTGAPIMFNATGYRSTYFGCSATWGSDPGGVNACTGDGGGGGSTGPAFSAYGGGGLRWQLLLNSGDSPTETFYTGVTQKVRIGAAIGVVTASGVDMTDGNVPSCSGANALNTDGSGKLQCGPATGTTYTAGSGLSLSSTTFSLDVAHANAWSGQQTFAGVKGTSRTVSITTDTILSTDCGKTIVFTSGSAITLTTLASIVSGTDTCSIAVYQGGAGQVTISDGAGATHNSPHAYTKTFGQYSTLELFIEPNNPSLYIIAGDGA